MKKSNLMLTLKSVKYLLVFFVIFSFIQAIIVSINPLLMRYLVDTALPGMDISLVIKAFILILILIACQTVVYYINQILSAKIVKRMDIDIKNRLVQNVLEQEHRFFLQNKQSTLQNIIQKDTYVIASFLNRKIIPIISQVTVFIIVLVVMLNLNVRLALIALFLIIPYFFIYTLAGKKLEALVPDYYKFYDRMTSAMQRILKSFEVIKSFNKEKYEAERYRDISSSYYENDMKMTDIEVKAESVAYLFGHAMSLGLFGYAILMVVKGQTTLGTAIAFYSFMGRFLDPVQTISGIAAESKRFTKSLERVDSVLKTEAVSDTREKHKVSEFQDIEFKEVFFKYDEAAERNILNNVSMKLESDKIYAVVGDSGSGKSTLAKLIMGFFDADSGDILINKHSIKDICHSSLRRLFGYIPQDSYLLPGSLRENLTYGAPSISEQDIQDTLKALKLDVFVDSLSEGLDTSINELGTNLSGGEKQRLAIGRAILSNAKFIIADEISGNLDVQTEISVMDTVFSAVKGKTALIIAHRLATIVRADTIFVMKNGAIIESGTHEELLSFDGVYASLWNRQVSET
ncbi:MAG: ABC transporter ATP-binding protein [Candidatus Cloacimonadaceae bacterium]